MNRLELNSSSGACALRNPALQNPALQNPALQNRGVKAIGPQRNGTQDKSVEREGARPFRPTYRTEDGAGWVMRVAAGALVLFVLVLLALHV